MKSKKFSVWAVGSFALLACVLLYKLAFADTAPAPDPSPFVWPPTLLTVAVCWPLISGLISVFYNYLDHMPRTHALLSLAVKCGLDLPGILDALKRALTGALTPAAAAKLAAKVAKPMVLLVGALTLVSATSACTPAQKAEMSQIEQVVLRDIEAGKSLPQVEQDVATVIAGRPGADVVLLVDDALAFLVDMHLVPPQFLPFAKQLAASEHPRALAHRTPTISMLHPVETAQGDVDAAGAVIREAGGQ